MAELNEKELVAGIRANAPAAVKAFVDQFHGRTRRIVQRMLGKSCEDVADLTSEILWEAIVKVRDGGFDEERGCLAPYLYGITSNRCKNYFKRQKKGLLVPFSHLRASYPQDQLKSLERDMSLFQYRQELEASQVEEMRTLMEKAIQQLEEKHKKLVYLKYYRGYSYEQISVAEKIPVAKVKSRLFEARRKLEKAVLKRLSALPTF